ncbi:hypothetical protein GCM10009574_090720 [Streptomyces asiaticus]|uniref:Transposase n=2 Tax=Streptomyces rhizosphaericus TaxID=114699 RepID=A0ABN1SK52_9ACTN
MKVIDSWKLKTFRAVATRFDKRGYVYLGTVTAAALGIWLRGAVMRMRKPSCNGWRGRAWAPLDLVMRARMIELS